jgi:D-threonate/D-erythronate kinase
VIRYLIADDLTGAADAAVHFAGSRKVEIQIPLPARWGELGRGLPDSGGLTVLDTESRHLPADQAAAAVTLACRGLGDGVLKKVDSTLRGPVAAELEAACLALGRSTAVLSPSLPAQGRTVHGGRLLVDGVDAGSVAEILGAAAVLLPVEALAGGPLFPLVVIDASTDADLARVAAACDGRPDLLPAGSAGLAAAFARLEGAAAPTSAPPSRRILVAVASRHPAARAQLAALAAEPHPAIQVLAVPPDAEGLPEELAAALGREVGDRVRDLLPEFGGIPPLRGGETIVLATGGDAALAVCRELGISTIRPRAEVLPGVVWSETGREDVALATKAGGFGGPRLLLDVAFKLLGVDSDG